MRPDEKGLSFIWIGVAMLIFSSVVRADDPPRPSWYDHYDWQNLAYERKFVSPLERPSQITSHFGPRIAPLPGASEWHEAIDLHAIEGTPVFAAYPGMIVAS